MNDVLIIDISKWQDNNETPQKMNFKQAADRGVTAVFIKATQYQADPDFADNWRNAKEAGLLRGAYHFAYYSKTINAKIQAQFLWNTIKHDPGELPPVLDFETRDGIGLSWIKQFLEEIKVLSGKTPILYTGISVWNELKESENAFWVLEYPLWISYPQTKLPSPVRGIPDVIKTGSPTFSTGKPALPTTWIKKNVPWTFWQFSYVGDGLYYGAESKGLDMNVFNGGMVEFMAWAGCGEYQEPGETPIAKQYVEIIAKAYLRFRPEPIYNPNIKTLIVERGQVLEIAGTKIYEPPVPGLHDGIKWLPVFTPSIYENELIGYISANNQYVRYL